MRRLLAVVALAVASVAVALEVPPTPTGFVTDGAAVLAGREEEIGRRFAAIEQRTGHQVIVVLLPSLEGDSLEDFTIRAAERFKVGRKGLDDGAIFFAFLTDRRMRLEVGYGLEEKIPDALAKRLLDGTVKPAFARGDYAGGLVALADGFDRIFSGEALPEAPRRGRRSGLPIPGLIFIVIVILLQVVMRGAGMGGRRSRRWGGGGWLGGSGGSWGGGGGGGFGGFSAGGGSFGGGGASGSW